MWRDSSRVQPKVTKHADPLLSGSSHTWMVQNGAVSTPGLPPKTAPFRKCMKGSFFCFIPFQPQIFLKKKTAALLSFPLFLAARVSKPSWPPLPWCHHRRWSMTRGDRLIQPFLDPYSRIQCFLHEKSRGKPPTFVRSGSNGEELRRYRQFKVQVTTFSLPFPFLFQN